MSKKKPNENKDNVVDAIFANKDDDVVDAIYDEVVEKKWTIEIDAEQRDFIMRGLQMMLIALPHISARSRQVHYLLEMMKH